MGFPESNLPSLDGQRHYMVVQELTKEKDIAVDAHHCYSLASSEGLAPQEANFENMRKYYGFDMIISRSNRKGVLCSLTYTKYSVQFDEKHRERVNFDRVRREARYALRYDRERRFIVRMPQYEQSSNTFIRKAQTALYYAFSPVERSTVIHTLLSKMAIEDTARASYLSRLAIQALLEKTENSFNRIDREHVALLMRNNTAENLHAQTKHIYINVVYDCNSACSQAMLSDQLRFERYTRRLLCTRGLLEFNNILNVTNYSVNTSLDNGTVLLDNEHNNTQSCSVCIQNILPIAVGAIVTMGSTIAIFTKVSNSKCAKAVRSYFARLTRSAEGTQRVQYDAANIEEIEIEQKAEAFVTDA